MRNVLMKKSLLSVLILLGLSPLAYAESLLDIYHQAQEKDQKCYPDLTFSAHSLLFSKAAFPFPILYISSQFLIVESLCAMMISVISP